MHRVGKEKGPTDFRGGDTLKEEKRTVGEKLASDSSLRSSRCREKTKLGQLGDEKRGEEVTESRVSTFREKKINKGVEQRA